jgi:hypothetical protein
MTKSTEEAIKQVLTGLRDSEAPAGMERRILEAVHDRASVKSRSRWHRLRPMWLMKRPTLWSTSRSLSWGVALACTIAICFAVSMLHRIEHVPAQSNLHSTPIATPPPAASKVIAKNVKLPSPASRAQSMAKTNARKARLVHDSDSVALREMRAASHPPPPMPLTEQEKLLLRIAHKGDPVQLAALDPAVRAARNTEEKAEVQRFFEPSKTGDHE